MSKNNFRGWNLLNLKKDVKDVQYTNNIKHTVAYGQRVAYETLLKSCSYNKLALNQNILIWYFNWEGHML